MILPNKHLSQERALLTIGARVLRLLGRPKTVSAVWEELGCRQDVNVDVSALPVLTYDWFVLTLDLLFAIGAVELREGLLRRQST